MEFTKEDEYQIHLSNIHLDLGNAYEGEYLFDKALSNFLIALELTPFYAHCYIKVAHIFTEMNKSDEAIDIYKVTQKANYMTKMKCLSMQ